ncbi:hypothetical protein BDV29DRAFT_106802 [Aspergillus leporis]|jgi:hypothetical protein|uniref:Uncharacterized protein n=1 Tax=Aspergillus leporis TaxID=41062 RepID=A0A5N5X892_9EURO|nr:hypothetical protein BDV29DRAFT_106802 [Aspergillus leporis]
MGDSDTEASTGAPSVRRQPQRNAQRPTHLSEDQERGTLISGAKGRRKSDQSRTRNGNAKTSPSCSSAVTTEIQQLHQQLEAREQHYEEEITKLQQQVTDLMKIMESNIQPHRGAPGNN